MLEELRRRADFTNKALQIAHNDYILVVVSDFREDSKKRDWLNRVINKAESALAVPSLVAFCETSPNCLSRTVARRSSSGAEIRRKQV